MSFEIRGTIICDTCHQPLSCNINPDDNTSTITHPTSECARSGQHFNPPTIDLVQV